MRRPLLLFLLLAAIATVAAFTAPTAQAGTLWIEDWSTQNLDKWYTHTLNAQTDSYSFQTNPGALVMNGYSWGLESKQSFNEGAPISAEASVKVNALTANTQSFAGITIYNGEGGYGEIALVNNLDGNGLRLFFVTEGVGLPLPDNTEDGFLNRNLDPSQFYKLKVDYDGHGTWRLYVNDVPRMVYYNKYLTSSANVFILSVADNSACVIDPNGAGCQPAPTHAVQSVFKELTVRGNYNRFGNTTWVSFNEQVNTQVDTENGSCAYGQCDYLQLMKSPGYLNYYPTGYTVSPLVTLPTNEKLTWGEIYFTTALDGQDISVHVLESDGDLVPDTALPGNTAGFRSSPVNLSGLDRAAYPSLKLRANFATGDVTRTPRLLDWALSFGIRNYFTWYDQQSFGMKDWLLMSNANTYSSPSNFIAQLGSPSVRGPTYHSANPGSSAVHTYPGIKDGPLTVNSLSGLPQVISQRILYKDSLEETLAVSEERLSDHYYWAWYDELTAGFKNWVLISNPGTATVRAQIYISGQLMADPGNPGNAYFDIPAGQTVTPRFPGVKDGPVEVKAFVPGGSWSNSSDRRDVIASQRVTSNNDAAFNEVFGTPAEELAGNYFWTWYDVLTPGMSNWILVANPSETDPVYYEILIAGNNASGGTPVALGPGEIATRIFPGWMGGPVEIRSWTTADRTAAADVVASQRSTYGSSFEEVPGYDAARLSSNYIWTWYDNLSSGSVNWVLVSNPNADYITADIFIGDAKVGSYDLRPFGNAGGYMVTPRFAGRMGGPVEVRAYARGGSYAYPFDHRQVIASQRVLWSGNFNEVEGSVLD